MAGDRANEAEPTGRHLNVGSLGLLRISLELGAVGEGYVVLNRAIVDQLDRVALRLLDLQVGWLKARIDAMDIKYAKRWAGCRRGRVCRRGLR